MLEFIAAVDAPPAANASWGLLILYFCLAIFVSFACSIFEAVLLSISRPYIENLKESDPDAGNRLDRLKTEVNRPLTAILTLNTIAHTVGAFGVGQQAGGLAGGW